MKRLWIRAHALVKVWQIVDRDIKSAGVTHDRAQQVERLTKALAKAKSDNAMVVVEVSDELAAIVAKDAYLMAAGRVLKDGEEPPYLGEEGKENDDAR